MINQALYDPYLQLYVRLRGNANADFEGNIDSWSGTVEVQPYHDPLKLGTPIPIGNAFLTVWPLFRAQYFAKQDRENDPLFASAQRVFRAGPAISLRIKPRPSDDVPALLRNLTFNASYVSYTDFEHDRTFPHFYAKLTHNLTANFGISLSYEKGKIEEDATSIDLTSVGFSLKY